MDWKTLYYCEIKADGTAAYLTSAVVDENSTYTITQNNCSDYIAAAKAPEEQKTPSKTTTSPDKKIKPEPES